MAEPRAWFQPNGLGWIIALVVLIVCIVAAIIGKPAGLSMTELFLIGALALSRLI